VSRDPAPASGESVRRADSVAPSSAAAKVDEILANYLSGPNRKIVLRLAAQRAAVDPALADDVAARRIADELTRAGLMFVPEPARSRCVADLSRFARSEDAVPSAALQGRHRIEVEADVIRVRAAVRAAALELSMGTTDTTRLVTAVSELARNALQYAGGGEVVVRVLREPAPLVEVVVSDRGPGIPNLDEIMAGRYRSKHGMGVGLRATKSLCDEVDIDTKVGLGTTVRLRKRAMVSSGRAR
jgi:serine/threonine-protein kinase RsbT